ncbi:MAG: ABC transporter permease subunit [Peptococcaceae bacterium]|nr:ABC transporter permease subunit [Peptococcaceae bacterium]
MGLIFRMALTRTLRPKLVVLYLIINAAVTVVTALFVENLSGSPVLQGGVISFNMYFAKLVFLWILGVSILLWIAVHGIRMIGLEKKEGTLLLLVSKPVSRYRIILGKYFALIFSALVVGVSSLFLDLSVIVLMFSPDPVIILQLFKTIPFLSLYLLFLSFCTSAFSLSVSILSKTLKKTYFVLSLIILFIYFGVPLLRPGVALYQELRFLLYFDINTHLSSIFHYFLSLPPGIILSPKILWDLSDWYTGILPSFLKIAWLQDYHIKLLVNPQLVLVIWLTVSMFVLGLSARRFNKMDIME